MKSKCSHLAIVLGMALGVCWLFPTPVLAQSQASLKTRWRAAHWNLKRALAPTDPSAQELTLTSVAGARKRTLREIMRTFPPPTREELHGRWRGLNKGVGPAILGLSQFSKEFCTLCPCPHGDNITIHQREPECWCSASAWCPVCECGTLDRHGNFKVNCPDGRRPFPCALELNYTQAPNPAGSPERLIVDKLVKLDDDHLLGFSTFQVGKLRFPGYYFVLERVHVTDDHVTGTIDAGHPH
jgi:hypothetical protein